jgi:H+/Cl- antiporter ClcA
VSGRSGSPAERPTGASGLEPTTTAALHPDRGQARGYLLLIGLGAVIGIPAAFLAWLFLGVVHWLEDLLWTELPRELGESAPPWYLVIGLPVVGAGVVALARRFLPGDGGHSPLAGLGGAPTPLRYGPGVALAALGTLAFGAVLGPEAPLIALGSVVGMAVTPFVRLDPRGQAVIANAGSFSAVSALFGGPLVAGFLLVESGLAAGAALLPMLLPGLVAAAVGYLLFVGLGDWAGLPETPLAVPDLPAYQHTDVVELLLAVGVGVLTSLVISEVKSLGHAVDRLAVRRTGRAWTLLAGGLLVGLLAQAVQVLGGDSQDLLFSGQSAIPDLLAETSVAALLVLVAAKALGYAICLGCGFRGGPVFPAIFIGVGVAVVSCILLDTSVTWALVVGTAAGMTSGTGLVFSALLFSMLLAGTGGQDALPAAVFAVTAAWLTNAALTRRAERATAAGPSAGPRP